MSRTIPPFTYTEFQGKRLIMLGDSQFAVDPNRSPAFFFQTYLEKRLPSQWLDEQRKLDSSERHRLFDWFDRFQTFLKKFESRGNKGEYKDILDAPSRAMTVIVNDMYTLDGNRRLQDSLIHRLIKRESFQGAMHELSVAATMTRAGFDIEFEDESDSSRKHPEFVATHKNAQTKVAVEAKSIHRTGVLGFEKGKPPPTTQTADAHKIAAQIGGQVARALPKAGHLPLYVFVDLNLPPAVAEQFGPSVVEECKSILGQIDTGYDENGIRVGKSMNLLTITNRAMHLGEERHIAGDTVNAFIAASEEQCRCPEASRHIGDVKEAVTNYGTFPGNQKEDPSHRFIRIAETL